MKNFRDALKRKMEKEGWTVEHITNSPINLRCEREKKVKLICAWQNGHGHIYKDTLRGLKIVQKSTGMPVVVAKVNGANEIVIIRLEKFKNFQKVGKMIFLESIANGQTDLDNNRLVSIPSGWADGYFEICRIRGGAKW